jgi:hypothetical protein
MINVIERCFGRLKDFRRIATRYGKLAGNFYSALCFVAIVAIGFESIESGPSRVPINRACRVQLPQGPLTIP